MRIMILATLFLVSCGNDSNKVSDDKKSSDTTVVTTATSDNSIRNEITLTAEGITVEQAFLLFEDGKLVPSDNKVEVGQKVQLRLIINDWKTSDGKVYLGASEKIETNSGQVVLDEQDLFANLTDGIDPTDAKAITLSAVITRVDRLYDHFVVSFRVWNKKFDEEVSGSYKLYLK